MSQVRAVITENLHKSNKPILLLYLLRPHLLWKWFEVCRELPEASLESDLSPTLLCKSVKIFVSANILFSCCRQLRWLVYSATMKPMGSAISLVVLLAVVMRAGSAEGLITDTLSEVNTFVRSAALSFYGIRQLTIYEQLVGHFYKGLDEVKMCLMDTEPLPTLTWGEALKARLVPGYAKVLQERQENFSRRSNKWAGCVIGTVRSSASGYLVVSNAMSNIIPVALSSITGPASGFIDSSLSFGRNVFSRSLPYRKFIRRGIAHTSRKVLGWK